MIPSLVGIAKDENDNILWKMPYPFTRLFKKGQLQIVNSIEYKTIKCEKKDNIVNHILRKVSI